MDTKSKERSIYKRLKWIKKYTKTPLSKNGEKIYADYVKEFGVQEDPLEETAVRSGAGWVGDVYKRNISYSDFTKFSIEKHIEVLKESDAFKTENPGRNNYYDGSNSSEQPWKEWSQKDPELAIKTITKVTEKYFSVTAWNGVSRGFSEQLIGNSENKDAPRPRNASEYTSFLKELLKLKNSQLKDFIYSASNAIRHFIQCEGLIEFDQGLFIKVFERTYSVAKTEKMVREGDLLQQAINHSVGLIAQALIGFMWAKSEGKRGNISRSFTKYFDQLLQGKSDSTAYAKVILAEHLYNMHVFLPEWTKAKIIPLFNWADTEDAYEYWYAFMHHPNVSKGLAESIKPHLLGCFKKQNIEKFEKDSIRQNLIHLATL